MPEKKQQSKSSGFGLANLILIVAIVGVLFTTQTVRDHIETVSKEMDSMSAPLSKESLQINNDKSRCPRAQQDHKSCLQKLQRCKDTELQFAKAESDFTKLIQECKESNDENERINIQMEKELIKLQAHMKTIEK